MNAYDFNAYNQLTHVARCVSQEDYVFVNKLMDYDVSKLRGRRAYAMLTGVDRRTPMEVDTFNVSAGPSGDDLDQSKKCRDCLELGTDPLAPDTESLKAQVRLLTAGAATGVLWLALMSG